MKDYGDQSNGWTNEHEVNLRDYVRVLFRQKWVVFNTITTVMAVAIVGVIFKTPVYQSEVKMLISGYKQAQADYYTDIGLGGIRSSQIAMTQIEIVSADPVIERTVVALGLANKPYDYEKRFSSKYKKPYIEMAARKMEKELDSLPKEQKEALLFRMAMEDLRKRMEVEPIRETDLFFIKVSDFNPIGAAVTANVLSRSYVIFDLEQQLAEIQLKYGEKNLAVTQLEEAITKMSESLNGAPLPSIKAIGPASVKIIEQAKVPLKPAGIPRSLTVVLAFIMSLFLSVMLAFGFEYSDQTFRSTREVESFLGIKYIGGLRKKARKADIIRFSEQLYLTIQDRGLSSVLFVSALAKEGIAKVISNFAIYTAETLGKSVLLVDANLRNPGLAKLFKLPEGDDFIEVMQGRQTPDKAVHCVSPNLHVLAPGRPVANPVAVLESDVMKDIMFRAREIYDLVLVEAAPLEISRDAVKVSTFTEGTVVVVDARKTRRHVAKNALDLLRSRKVNILGLVLNNQRFDIPKFIYDRI